jgi:hypothetical protein
MTEKDKSIEHVAGLGDERAKADADHKIVKDKISREIEGAEENVDIKNSGSGHSFRDEDIDDGGALCI